MEVKDFISIIISSISLIISLYVFFSTYLRPAKIKLLLGNNLILFNSYVENSSGKQWGGLSFYLPVTFYNWSHRGGEVNQLRMVIGRPDNALNYCDMSWANFAQITGDEVRLKIDTQGIAQPVAIPGQSSITRMIRFNWGPAETPLDIQPGEYELIVYGWTEEKDKPNLRSKVSFLLSEPICKVYAKHVSQNLVEPILIPLGDMRLPNNTFTRKGVIKTFEG